MKNKLPVFAIFLALAIGILAFSPISPGSSAADLGVVVQLGPDMYVAEVEDQVCASESPVHTTSSQPAATADAEDGGSLPSIYLMMLEDGVCASLSPIATTTLAETPVDAGQWESIDRKTAAKGAEAGVWYVQN